MSYLDLENNISTDSESSRIALKDEIIKYIRFWPWFIVSLFVFLFGAYFLLRYSNPIYESTAKVKILDESEGLELPTTGFIFNRSNINLENEIEMLTSYLLLEKVVKTLNLSLEFYDIGTIQTTRVVDLPFNLKLDKPIDSLSKTESYFIEIAKDQFNITDNQTNNIIVIPYFSKATIINNLPFKLSIKSDTILRQSIGKKFAVNFVTLKNSVQKLKNIIKIEPVGTQSDLLKLNIKSENYHFSESVLNTLINVFNKDGINDRQLVSQRTINFIDDRFIFLAKELDSIEINYQGFKEQNNLVDIASDATVGIEQRTFWEKELFKIESQIELVQMLENSLKQEFSNKLLPANIGLENKGLNDLISNFNLAVIEFDMLSSSAGENNPALIRTGNNLRELKVNINQSLKTYLNQLDISKNQFQNRAVKFEGQVSKIPKKERLLKSIVRQQKIKESLYLLLLQKREEAAINLAITEPSIKVVEYALTSLKPVSPKSGTVYSMAILAGILVPSLFIYMMFLLDTKVHTRDDIEKLTTNIPILAEIPEIKKKGNLLFTNPNATSVLAESFRILAANVSYVLPKSDGTNKGKVIFSTSTIKGEGKTFVSLNLSLALASLNKKVLLIGADMRNPQIHTYFGTSKNEVGLSSYLNDASVNWREILLTGFDKHPKHHTMISGAIPPNPAHLLTNGRFEQLLDEVRAEFDYVIVDTAPTILVTDTLLISKFADVTLFLTKANYTDKKLLKFSKELSESGKIKNMAYVMNSVGAGKSYSYGYGYGYNYGYSYGYHEEN